MQAVVERLWDGYAELDFVTDRLRPRVREEARLVGVPPKLEIELPWYVAGPAPVLSADARGGGGVRKRSGWLGLW